MRQDLRHLSSFRCLTTQWTYGRIKNSIWFLVFLKSRIGLGLTNSTRRLQHKSQATHGMVVQAELLGGVLDLAGNLNLGRASERSRAGPTSARASCQAIFEPTCFSDYPMSGELVSGIETDGFATFSRSRVVASGATTGDHAT